MTGAGSEREQLGVKRVEAPQYTHAAGNACHISLSRSLDCLVNSHPGSDACKITNCELPKSLASSVKANTQNNQQSAVPGEINAIKASLLLQGVSHLVI